MSWLDQLVGALAGGAEAGANFYNKRQQQQREDEELKLQRVRQAKLDQMAEDQAAWTRSQGERANTRQDRLDAENASDKALERSLGIAELSSPTPLSPTVAAPLAKAGMPLKGLSFSMPALDGGSGFTAGPGTTVQANDPARNIGMMRGWQTQAEKAKADLDKQMADRLAAIVNDPTLPAPLRRMFEQQARGNQTSNTRVQDYMTPEEQQKALEAETNQAIRLTNAQEAARARHRPASEPLIAVAGPDGQPVLVPRSDASGRTPASATKPPTAAQQRDARFYRRMEASEQTFDTMEKDVLNMSYGDQLQLEYAPNVLQTPQGQKLNQAMRAFTEARLRADSGAAVPQHEYDNDRVMYFPQPGDTKETLQQKRLARQVVIDSFRESAGPALASTQGKVTLVAPDGDEIEVSEQEAARILAADPKVKRKGGL